MGTIENLFDARKSLDEICTVPDKIISVYSLEKHIWADANSPESRKKRKPELQTVEEFQIGPVRFFLNDILRNMAAPYKADKKENPIGQGYWIQAEFGSGKSHLLCFLGALALGNEDVWQMTKAKEGASRQGKRESLYRFWEEGLKNKSTGANRGMFVVARTLVGSGGGAVGISDKGKRLSEYILESIKEQMQVETGKNLSLYPAEILADRFINEDLDRYRKDLKRFLRDPNYFAEDAFEESEEFIKSIQQNKSPEYKRSCGNKLWRFYTEYLKVQPQVPAETEDILKHVVETIMAEGYTGLLLILDEISLFMKDRDPDQRVDDEKTLVVLANRLAKVHNLPVWTICAAQQAIEARPGLGVKNIIADDRLKLVPLLQNPKDYYDIVLSRVREIKNPGAINNYYLHYSNQFTWPKSIGEKDFAHFFPFHQPAVEVLRDITHELTTARSAIHFMHQTLKQQTKVKGRELIRLWELFDETIAYEEDPSGTHAGLVAIKTKRETEYRAYLACRNQVDGLTRGTLKVNRDRAVRIIQTLFLYHVAHSKLHGLNAEELANAVMIARQFDATPEENIQHYEILADALKTELPQIAESYDEAKMPRYRFEPVVVGIDPNREFQKARDEAESNEAIQTWAWERLLAMGEWPVKTRHMNIDLAGNNISMFHEISPYPGLGGQSPLPFNNKSLEIDWQGRQVFGVMAMRDFSKMQVDAHMFPAVTSDQDDQDFAVYVASKPISQPVLDGILSKIKDSRVLLWTPEDLNHDERHRLLDYAAYLKMMDEWAGNETEDGVAIVNWVANRLKGDMGKIVNIIRSSYGRGRIDAFNNTQMPFHMAGETKAILTPLVDRILSGVYVSSDIKFEHPFVFKKEDAIKVINGIVKSGEIPRTAKPNQNVSAVQNFGVGLKIVKKSAERVLDVSDNPYVRELWDFIEKHLLDNGQAMKMETIFKNFMGMGGPRDYGLTRRMVQIYVLCLVWQGKIQITMGAKSGLSFAVLDYSNLESVEFSAKVVDSMEKIQKVAKPENWEVLRPYAEKLLNKSIAVTHDDAKISEYRSQLKEHFRLEKVSAPRVSSQAQGLFDSLGAVNLYDMELKQVTRLYTMVDLQSGNDIDLILYGLKESFGYKAFDENRADEGEINDLAFRLNCYRKIANFITYAPELRLGQAYCQEEIPDNHKLTEIRYNLVAVAEKLNNLKPYIDYDVKLKTELIGSGSAGAAETGTIGALCGTYTTAYIILHDEVTDRCERSRRKIKSIMSGEEWQSLPHLERINALHPAFTHELDRQLTEAAENIFGCSLSKRSIQDQLGFQPYDKCGLRFNNADHYLQQATTLEAGAVSLYEETLNGKLQILLHPAIRQRLEQGKQDPLIAQVLVCATVAQLREYLVNAVLNDSSVVDTINRYLKKIVVKPVKIADFTPDTKTIEMEQITGIGQQFEEFLTSQLNELIKELEETDDNEDTLPMLIIE